MTENPAKKIRETLATREPDLIKILAGDAGLYQKMIEELMALHGPLHVPLIYNELDYALREQRKKPPAPKPPSTSVKGRRIR